RYVAEGAAPRVFVGQATVAERAACQQAWRKWFESKGKVSDLADRHTRPGRPCVLLVFYAELGKGKKVQISTTGCDGVWRYQISTAGYIVDWLPEGGFLAWSKDGGMEFLDLSGASRKRIDVPIWPAGGFGYFGQLPGGNFVGISKHWSAIVEFDRKGKK